MLHSTRAIVELHDQLDTLLTTLKSIASSWNKIGHHNCQDASHSRPSNLYNDTPMLDGLSRLGRTLPALLAHEDELRSIHRAIHDRCNIVAPINHIPDEIIVWIFQLLPIPDRTNEVSVIIRMSGVCRRWRTVAIETPILWSRIRLHYLARPHYIGRLCLERSKACPLHVSLREHDDDLLRLVVSAVSRWETLKLTGVPLKYIPHVFSLFLSIIDDLQHPPRLKSLKLNAQSESWTPESTVLFSRFMSTCVDLRVLRLVELHPPVIPELVNITHLTLCYRERPLPIHVLARTLATCPRLVTLKLRHMHWKWKDASQYSTIILSDLEELVIHDLLPPTFTYVCRHLVTPNLRSLSIANEKMPEEYDADFALLLQRNSAIRTLRLASPLYKIAKEALASLTSLDAVSIGWYEHYCACKTLKSLPGHLFPRLSELRIRSFPNGLMLEIENFLNARREAFDTQFPLPLSLSFNCGKTSDLTEQMERDRVWLSERVQLRDWTFMPCTFLSIRPFLRKFTLYFYRICDHIATTTGTFSLH